MATLKQYFDTDFNRVLSTHQPFLFKSESEDIEVVCRIHYDFDANVIFISYYIPLLKALIPLCAKLIEDLDWSEKMIQDFPIEHSKLGGELIRSTSLQFSGQIHIYSELDLSFEDLTMLKEHARQFGRSVRFYGSKYAIERSKLEKPLAFISHDSRDKDEIARPLAINLSMMMCPVWYDEYSLKLGTSLRESIETGLKECKKCVLILTQIFYQTLGGQRQNLILYLHERF
jgi:hypothetical protein